MAQKGIRKSVLVLTLGICACSTGGEATQTTASETATVRPGPITETPWTDAETTAPAPPSSLQPGPGGGSAQLVIMVMPSVSEPTLHYTLRCRDGLPTEGSQHPSAAKACHVLKNNPAMLNPQPRSKEVVCSQQYGGPRTAIVTGTVDKVPVNISFALRDGCEISQRNAAESILGPIRDL